MSVGLAQKFLVNNFNRGIVVRTAQSAFAVVVVKRLRTHGFKVYRIAYLVVNVGLSSSVYTSAGTSHNFYKRVILFTALYSFYNLSCIAKPACHRNFYGCTADGVFGFLDALRSADLLKLQRGAASAEFVSRRS